MSLLWTCFCCWWVTTVVGLSKSNPERSEHFNMRKDGETHVVLWLCFCLLGHNIHPVTQERCQLSSFQHPTLPLSFPTCLWDWVLLTEYEYCFWKETSCTFGGPLLTDIVREALLSLLNLHGMCVFCLCQTTTVTWCGSLYSWGIFLCLNMFLNLFFLELTMAHIMMCVDRWGSIWIFEFCN